MSLAHFQTGQCVNPISAPAVSVSNEYDLLSEDEEAPTLGQPPQQRQGNVKKPRVPPIIVTGTSVGNVHRLIVSAGVVHYSTNTTTKGITVHLTNTSEFKTVLEAFKQGKINFFTHQLPEDRTTKIILFGLPEMSVDDLIPALVECKIFPTTVKKLQIRKKRYEDQAMYLLHFSKGSITLGELKQVRYVNHHRVYFEYYPHKNGPIQCRNCQQYGHGEANCVRAPVCVKCAEPHASHACPLSKTTTNPDGKIAQAKLRCANCGDHHTANFHGCENSIS